MGGYFLIKGISLRDKTTLKKAGISGLLMISSFVLFGITSPDSEKSNAEESTRVTVQDIKEQSKKEDKQKKELEKNEKEKKERAEQKAQEEKEKERLAEEKAREEERKKEEKQAKEKAEQEEKKKEEQISKEKKKFEGYRLIKVDGGNLSGYREANVVVDIGFGDREYWAYTNEHGQLIRVVADEIIVQDDLNEPVKNNGRYYHDEAKVPGTESGSLDEGHVIADSLGGVSNAYNITPQNSTMNRHGDQAYMERNIRLAKGATDFEAIITYPDTKTQIPNNYKFTYTINGNKVVDEFENVNPDEYNKDKGITESKPAPKKEKKPEPKPESKPEAPKQDISGIDANGNGKVTIPEAEDAGFVMPIKKGHWLYPYMIDKDGDGMVGESSR